MNKPSDRPPDAQRGTPRTPASGEFDERRYLAAFPDVASAVAEGKLLSGQQHFQAHGQKENRLADPAYLTGVFAEDTANFPSADIDVVFLSQGGWCLVIGWLNDPSDRLVEISYISGGQRIAAVRSFARCRREDAERIVPAHQGKLLGFWTVFHMPPGSDPCDNPRLCLSTSQDNKTFAVKPVYIPDDRIREMALEYLASSKYFSNPHVEAVLQLNSGVGETIVDLNAQISCKVVAGAHMARFGSRFAKVDASIVVCLFGKAEYLFLQAAAFSSCPGIDSYEFIFVSNSPELSERLMKEATIASEIYGLNISLVMLPNNAGFSAANNIAVEFARGGRILFVNPDVFPRDSHWARKHASAIDGLPRKQTMIFGVPLFYDDGSLMHAGMFFDVDTSICVRDERVERHDLIRVEHYAKGAPPESPEFLRSRKVPAVTGAFISLSRPWFEKLGGFSTHYIFGHYEDADLCLRSLQMNNPVWVHNIPLWHLEGKGSTRRTVHEGGSTVNR